MAGELDPRMQETERITESLEAHLRAQIAKTESGTRIALIVGIIVIAIIFTAMTVLTNKLREQMEPNQIAADVSNLVEDKAKDVMDQAEASLKDNAPANVKKARELLMAQLPVLREKSEKQIELVVDKLDKRLDAEMEKLTAEVSAKISEQKAKLTPIIELASEPNGDLALQKEFTDEMKAVIQPAVASVMNETETKLRNIGNHLDMLAERDESRLDVEEMMQKDLLLVVVPWVQEFLAQAPMVP